MTRIVVSARRKMQDDVTCSKRRSSIWPILITGAGEQCCGLPRPHHSLPVLGAPGPSLHRRAGERAVRAEHAAIAGFRAQLSPAGGAVVEEQAGVGRHRLGLAEAASRADERRLADRGPALRHKDSRGRPAPLRGTGRRWRARSSPGCRKPVPARTRRSAGGAGAATGPRRRGRRPRSPTTRCGAVRRTTRPPPAMRCRARPSRAITAGRSTTPRRRRRQARPPPAAGRRHCWGLCARAQRWCSCSCASCSPPEGDPLEPRPCSRYRLKADRAGERNMRSGSLQIGELSRRAGCNIETIRYYERVGLLPHPARSTARYRLYEEADIGRLVFVRRARELGFTLKQVCALLALAAGHGRDACTEARELAAGNLAEVRAKIADLRALERVLSDAVRRCDAGEHAGCPVIATLSAGPARRPSAPGEHGARK